MCGVMRKRKDEGIGKKWRKKYVTLHKSVLKWYNDENDTGKKGKGKSSFKNNGVVYYNVSVDDDFPILDDSMPCKQLNFDLLAVRIY
jgi:hypothetical protein